MAALWPTVKQALGEFAQAVPDGDELEISMFSGSVRNLFAHVPATAKTRASWSRTIEALSSPRGAKTDLGLAAQSVLGHITSAPPDRLHFVFFLTDGRQDPAESSSFSSTWDGAWTALARQASQLVAARPLTIAIIRLSSDADQSLLARTFPTAVVTEATGPDALRSWFANARRGIVVFKLIALIQRELSAPIARLATDQRVVVSAGRAVDYPVHALYRRQILSTVPADSAPVRLATGEFVTPSATLWSADSGTLRMAGRALGLWVPPGSIAADIDERVVVRTRLEPIDELRRIGIDPGVRSDTLHLQLAIRAGGRLSASLYYLVVAGLLTVTLLLMRTLRRMAHRAVLDGRIIVQDLNGTAQDVTHVIAGRALKVFVVTAADGRTLVRLDAKNVAGRTVVEATSLIPGLLLDGKAFSTPQTVRTKCVFSLGDLAVTYFPS